MYGRYKIFVIIGLIYFLGGVSWYEVSGDDSATIPERIQSLISQLEQGNSTAYGQLIQIRDEQAFPVFLNALNSPHDRVRETAVYMMRWFKKKEVLIPLTRILREDPQTNIRSTAALSLGLLGYQEVGPFLMEGLNDPNEHVVQMVIRGLGFLKYQGAIDVLQGKLKGDNEDDWFIQSEAADALQKITGQDWSQGIHPCPPDFRVRDEYLTFEEAEKSLKYLQTRIPQLIQEAKAVQEIQNSEYYYIGYRNCLTTLHGYLLKQEVLLRKIRYDHELQAQQGKEERTIQIEELQQAYEQAAKQYQDFLNTTCWSD
jgi:hypothetical protein